jgi:diaminohydroxyphosphoribosylaminopyrimidine deaminase/5-amino-6-(5-phosphoribosylamino)uracil reductase
MKNLADLSYLEMAYGLAEKAKGRVSPNPLVGAVIVKNGVIVGSGYHEEAGKPHAEIIALREAGHLAKNAEAFITLEPCVHWGRTPPCVESLREAKLRRVVVSALDPNPLVFRKGIRKLKEAGIEVAYGLLQEKNQRLNEAYIKSITQKRPFLTVKAALTLDGRLATKRMDSRWISSSAAREYVHLLRGEHDALMVGIGTILKDDPWLTVRHANWGNKPLTRIILDSHLRFPLKAKILSTLPDNKIVIFTLNTAPPKKAALLRNRGVEVVSSSALSGRINLLEILGRLGEREVSNVLVEGGSRLITSLLEQKLADKIYMIFSPKFVGGEKAPSVYAGKGAEYLKDSLVLKSLHHYRIGEDIIMEGNF